jgi:hypothetical protein
MHQLKIGEELLWLRIFQGEIMTYNQQFLIKAMELVDVSQWEMFNFYLNNMPNVILKKIIYNGWCVHGNFSDIHDLEWHHTGDEHNSGRTQPKKPGSVGNSSQRRSICAYSARQRW